MNYFFLILSLPRVVHFKFLLQPHQKYYITQYAGVTGPVLGVPQIVLSCKVNDWESSLAERGVHRVAVLGSMSGWRFSLSSSQATIFTIAKCFTVYL